MKKLPIQSLVLAMGVMLLMSCKEMEPLFRIPEGHVGMFGYGSLMSKKFIQSSLLQKNYDGPFLAAGLKGYERSWSFAWPSSLPALSTDGKYYRDYIVERGDTIYPRYVHYLNIHPKDSSVINGVLYIVPTGDLPTYDSWELGYERVEVTGALQGYKIEGGPVFAYRALPAFEREPAGSVEESLIDESYVEIIENAFGYWGEEFRLQYENSTIPFAPDLARKSNKVVWEKPPLEEIEKLKRSFSYY